jgi:hypothetical protein
MERPEHVRQEIWLFAEGAKRRSKTGGGDAGTSTFVRSRNKILNVESFYLKSIFFQHSARPLAGDDI